MKEIKIYEIPNIDFIERIDDPYIGMIFYVTDIDAYYSVKTLKEINGINMKGSKVVEYVIDDYADFGTGSGGGSGLTATQLSNIAKIPAIKATVDALPNNYASKNHNHSEYASSSHRHDASEIDNLPSGGNGSSIDLSAYATKSELNDAIKRIDGMESAGNLVLRDISVGEIFIASDYSSSTTTYGNIVLSKSSVTIVEGGSDTFTIKLDKFPSQNQQVSLSVDNSSVILSKTIFEFTPSNFNVEQSVTITISEDDNYANEIATLTATSSNVPSKTLTINITDNDEQPSEVVNVQSVTLNKSTHTMKVDETVQLTPTISPSNATNKEVTWTASNSNCTVVNGLVTAKTQGECVITCKSVDGNKTATCTITVNAKVETPASLITDGLVSHYDMTRELSNGKIKDLHGGLDITLDTNYVVYENGYIATIDGGNETNYVTSAVAPKNTITNAYSVIVTFTLGTTNIHPICSTGLGDASQLLVYSGGLINYDGAFNSSQSATQIKVNTKYTVALTCSVGGNDTIYINGVKKYSEVTRVSKVGNQFRLFGAYSAKHTPTKIHNLALYDRVLTDEEVASVTLYLGGV